MKHKNYQKASAQISALIKAKEEKLAEEEKTLKKDSEAANAIHTRRKELAEVHKKWVMWQENQNNSVQQGEATQRYEEQQKEDMEMWVENKKKLVALFYKEQATEAEALMNKETETAIRGFLAKKEIEAKVWAENLKKESQAFISANIKEKMTKAQEWAEKWAVDFYWKFVQQGEAAKKEQRTEALDMWVTKNLQNVASFYNAMDAFLDEKKAEPWAKMHKNALLLGRAALSDMFKADLEGELLSQAQEECMPMNIDEIVAMLKED